jgi:hypothetical protein
MLFIRDCETKTLFGDLVCLCVKYQSVSEPQDRGSFIRYGRLFLKFVEQLEYEALLIHNA